MRSINKIVMLVALVLVSGLAYGQNSEDKTLLRTEQMAAKLGLNDSQKAQLDKQLKEANAERKAQLEKMRAFREEMRRDAFVARQQREAELKSILTPEQWAEYEKLKEQRKTQAKQRARGARGEKGRMRKGPGAGKRFKRPLPDDMKKGTDGDGN